LIILIILSDPRLWRHATMAGLCFLCVVGAEGL
jgi:hypothetical protein